MCLWICFATAKLYSIQEEDSGIEVDFDFDEDADENDASEVQNAVARDRKLDPVEAGVIHKIYCENLMNHRKLTVDFCRNINFIHGQVGCGEEDVESQGWIRIYYFLCLYPSYEQ